MNQRLKKHRQKNKEKRKREKIISEVRELNKTRAVSKKNGKSAKNYPQRLTQGLHSGQMSKSQYTRRSTNSARKNGFRINGKVIKKKVAKAKFIPRDIRKGNPFADLPVIKDEDLNEGIYNLVHQGFIPKEVDVEPILAREGGILSISKAK